MGNDRVEEQLFDQSHRNKQSFNVSIHQKKKKIALNNLIR